MRITTINTIELSSICDNECPYCPAKDQSKYRQVGFMTWEVFKKACEWVLYFHKLGTQKELNLFGVGESTLHPNIIEMVSYARKNLPFKQSLHLNTNGNKMTYVKANSLKQAGITSIDITGHKPEATARTIRIFREVGIPGQLSVDFMTTPNNWAGQVHWFPPDQSISVYQNNPCPWILKGQTMVMSDGSLTTCCIDAFGKNIFGNILKDDLNKLLIHPSELCKKCHHEIPSGLIKIYKPKGER